VKRPGQILKLLFFFAVLLKPAFATACLWDAETLFQEKWRSHDLAKTILGDSPARENHAELQARIQTLEANRDENNPEWWNNLAGAYVRSGTPEKTVELLKPVVSKFPNDYGLHANLGTAYHLLGHYAEAEKEIARDLEINPQAHFGLEKYHLALLQYLVRDSKYQSRHLYVDEFTANFLNTSGGRFYLNNSTAEEIAREGAQDYTNLAQAESDYLSFSLPGEPPEYVERHKMERLSSVATFDKVPAYRSVWDLGANTNFEAGVIYMAQMNPNEPACFEMLGVAAWRKHNYHLAVSAFEKAIALGSPKSDLLKHKIAGLKNYISNSPMLDNRSAGWIAGFLIVVLIPGVIAYYFYAQHRDRKARMKITHE
jgi:tetratricopeptide (TPR) repeat protein